MNSKVEKELASTNTDAPVASMNTVRRLIFGKSHQQIKHSVSDVVSEALLEREHQDGSVNKVLVPLVERSIERSIEVNRERIVNSLYPLVGKLVRKAVSTFLVEFVEKTNRILESSFSARGIVWRFRARQAGIPYADYVVAQIYQYRIEQIIIIHRETGTLLTSVAVDEERAKHADLLSSMLVAINDFVADAVVDDLAYEPTLHEIKTDSITLKIKIGPQAILVAAVTGNLPPEVQVILQKTLEEFHHFYANSLAGYNGDNSDFESAQGILVDSLLSDKREDFRTSSRAKRIPVLLILVAMLGYCSVSLFGYFQQQRMIEKLWLIDQQPGIVVEKITEKGDRIEIILLRDPEAPVVAAWIAEGGLNSSAFDIIERRYLSLDPAILSTKLATKLAEIPAIKVNLSGEKLALLGGVSPFEWLRVKDLVSQVPGVHIDDLDISGLTIENVSNSNDVGDEALIEFYQSRIREQVITFAVNTSDLSESHYTQIEQVANDLLALDTISRKSTQLLIVGSSDKSGDSRKNHALSAVRAVNVKQALLDFNVKEQSIVSTGIGELSTSEGDAGRMVMFVLIPNLEVIGAAG